MTWKPMEKRKLLNRDPAIRFNKDNTCKTNAVLRDLLPEGTESIFFELGEGKHAGFLSFLTSKDPNDGHKLFRTTKQNRAKQFSAKGICEELKLHKETIFFEQEGERFVGRLPNKLVQTEVEEATKKGDKLLTLEEVEKWSKNPPNKDVDYSSPELIPEKAEELKETVETDFIKFSTAEVERKHAEEQKKAERIPRDHNNNLVKKSILERWKKDGVENVSQLTPDEVEELISKIAKPESLKPNPKPLKKPRGRPAKLTQKREMTPSHDRPTPTEKPLKNQGKKEAEIPILKHFVPPIRTKPIEKPVGYTTIKKGKTKLLAFNNNGARLSKGISDVAGDRKFVKIQKLNFRSVLTVSFTNEADSDCYLIARNTAGVWFYSMTFVSCHNLSGKRVELNETDKGVFEGEII